MKLSRTLTPSQNDYLEFIRAYINENRSAPRLEEIADNFGVKNPTAHKTLETLQKKGYITFGRDEYAGFYIRMLDRAGTALWPRKMPVTGLVNRYGELFNFPKKQGFFESVVPESDSGEVFALIVRENIPEADMLSGDTLVCSPSNSPRTGSIVILPFGKNTKRFLLARVYELISNEDSQGFKWSPVGFSDETKEYFRQEFEKEGWLASAISTDFVVGVVLRLTRIMAL